MSRVLRIGCIAAVLIGIAGPAQALVIGGFDVGRGGVLSAESGTATGNFRAHIAAEFPGTTYASTSTLTPAFLSGIDVLIISAVKGDTEAISSLSAEERTALLGFVTGGGGALLLTDNDVQFEAASDSMVSPFGLDADGHIVGTATATVTNPSHPVTSGPFGAVTAISYAAWPGWYPTLGASATALARLGTNNEVSLAVIDRGVLAPGSGPVIFFADATIDNANYTGSTVTLVDNAIAYAVPEPGTLVLVASALGAVGLVRGRRARAVAGNPPARALRE